MLKNCNDISCCNLLHFFITEITFYRDVKQHEKRINANAAILDNRLQFHCQLHWMNELIFSLFIRRRRYLPSNDTFTSARDRLCSQQSMHYWRITLDFAICSCDLSYWINNRDVYTNINVTYWFIEALYVYWLTRVAFYAKTSKYLVWCILINIISSTARKVPALSSNAQ